MKFWGVAEEAGSVLASYTFAKESTPLLAGFRVAIGADYLGNRPGDSATDYTAATTPTIVIPKQPSFYLGARTLVNLTLASDSNYHWGVQVNVDNLFDGEYLQASIHRGAVFPGTPRNIRVTLRRTF